MINGSPDIGANDEPRVWRIKVVSLCVFTIVEQNIETTRNRDNHLLQLLVRVARTLRVGRDPHHFLYTPGGPGALNGRGQVVPGGVASALGPADARPRDGSIAVRSLFRA